MKFVIVISALLVVALADDKHGIKPVHEKCQNAPETHVDEAVFDDLKKHGSKATIPPNFNKHIECMAKGLNLVTPEGKANVDGIKTHVQHFTQEADKVDAIVKECAVDQATAEETAVQVWKCLYKKGILAHHHHHHHEGSNESASHETHETHEAHEAHETHGAHETHDSGEHHHGHEHNHTHQD